MLKVNNISKIYKNNKKTFFAAKDISFEIKEKEILSIVGDSGSGKSTIGQIIAGILKPDNGNMYLYDKKINYPIQKNLRKDIQILFQHPEASFNPKLKIYDSIKESYQIYRDEFIKDEIIDDIENLGLREEFLYRYPRELSGGELQRLSICRALSVNPKLLILDEPTSMLDVVSQAQIIRILEDFHKTNNTSYIFITHNRSLSKIFSDKEIFLEEGKIISKI